MSTGAAAAVFVVSLVATLAAAAVFAARLDHLGERLGLPEGILGLLTAAGACAPELATAITALARGEGGVGFGVVIGSNVFIVATMLGLSALAAGGVTISRGALALEGGTAFGVTAAMVLLVFGVLPPWAALVLALALAVPYAAISLRGERRPRRGGARANMRSLLLIPPAVAVIVLGSIGMVHAGLRLGHAAGLSGVLVGVLVLGVVTGIPNAYTGVRLGRARRGPALVSETMSSIAINLVGGLGVPALFVGVSTSGLARVDGVWLLCVTALAVLLLARGGGARRPAGAVLVLAWIAFAAVQAVHGG